MKAVALFSGGLDSALAIKLVQEQGLDVTAVYFASPFCPCPEKIKELAAKLKVELHIISKDKEYLDMIRHPKHGYGKNINPCIDCKIFIFREAKKYADEIGAKFLFTGEVLGQRPMSQHYKTLMLIEKEAGLEGKLLRPLSASLLPETEAEIKCWVDRNKLLDIKGRRRIMQLDLAKKYKIEGFTCGGSGCKLTNKEYAALLYDLFEHNAAYDMRHINLLSFGRHFRLNGSKIIVGRNRLENETIAGLKKKTDLLMQAEGIVGPTTLIINATKESIELAARLTARYSDAKENNVKIAYDGKSITVEKISDKDIENYRIR